MQLSAKANMAQVLYGDRIGQEGELRVGSCAVIFDPNREKVLLTRRSDNGLWCLPGGRMEPGESIEECCCREVFEETGLVIETGRLIGVYSNRDQLVVYKDGAKVQMIVLCFEAVITGGALGTSRETTEAGYFAFAELDGLEFHDRHKDRILDALANSLTPVLR